MSLSRAALGELLSIGAMPVAAILLIAAAILAARHRRWARWLAAFAGVAFAGMLVGGARLSAPLRDARRAQNERFAEVKVGTDREEVPALLGEPDLRCPGEGFEPHKAMATEEVRRKLLLATRERWIYFLPGSEPPAGRQGCGPLHGDGVVGFNEQGQVLWFVALTGESFLEF